jgi:hypothetical protein
MRRREALRAGVAVATAGLGLGRSPRRGAAHPGPYQPYGHIDLEGTRESVVGPDGTTVYVATMTGYATVDVAVPDRPRVLADVREPLADREGGPLRNVQDVSVDGDRLLVAGPANARPGALSGVLLVDVSEPDRPRELGFFRTDHPVHNCLLRDGRAYLTGNDGRENPLVVLSVADDDPTELGRWALADEDARWSVVPGSLRAVHDVWVHGDRAFVALWDAGTWVVDVSDPGAMAALGRVGGRERDELGAPEDARAEAARLPGNHHYAATDETGELLAVGKEAWAGPDGAGGPGGIDLWDVADPAEPVRLAGIDPPATADATIGGVWATAHNFGLVEDRLYSAWYQGGVKRHDVSDPTAPEELTWWRDPEAARFWTARPAVTGPDGFFIAASMGLRDVPARLYTFPDHAGTQADPPPLGAATPADGPSVLTPTASPGSDDATGTAGRPTGTATPSATGVSLPGPSVVGSVGAVGAGLAGLAGWWWLRDRLAADGDGEP